MAKLYFIEGEPEFCYHLDTIYEKMRSDGISKLKVFKAAMITGEPFFYCKKIGEVGETGEICGKQCDYYEPRNGKNGRCRHSKNTYESTDEYKILTL